MIKNYLRIALRNLARHKMLSGINIIGLAIGLACCMLIAMYVVDEAGYDRFHKKADRIVRVTLEYAFDGKVTNVAVTGNKVFPAFKRTFPEVENGVRLFNAGATIKYNDKLFEEDGFMFVDSTFFNVFSFPLLSGNPATALMRPNTVVLSRSSARKYFGDDNPIGKVLHVNNYKDYEVTGVAEDCPSNSQIKFDMVASWASQEGIAMREQWWNANYITYLLLRDPSAIKSLQSKIAPYMKTQNEENGLKGKNYMTFNLEPLTSVHLYSSVGGGLEPGGDFHYVYIFSAIALLILIIACANYMNLVTARASERAREVGIRKVMGAMRGQLFWQFLGESAITVSIAAVIALLLVKLALPTFNVVADKHLAFSYIFHPNLLIILLLTIMLVGMAGGGYPAMVLSGYMPIKVLKGNFRTSMSGAWLRKFLIITQFVISVGLIVCTLIINSQLNYIQHKRRGYTRDQVLVMPLDDAMRKNIAAVKSEFSSNSGVLNVSGCSQTPSFIPGKFSVSLDGKDIILTAESIDKDFVPTLGINMAHGENLDAMDAANAASEDSLAPYSIMINEAAVASFGWKPDEAIGKQLDFQGKKATVKGVVKDFHFSSLHETIGPLVLFMNGYDRTLLVKLSGSHIPETLAFLKSKWDAMVSYRPFQYQFLDEQFDRLYATEKRTGKIFYTFALLAIFLACLGLFGLASFMAQQRTREIGIRKVLGASVAGLVALLSKDFLRLVVIALIVASPLAWYGMHLWLEDFAYRISIGWWMFAVAGGLAIFIAFATISIQAIRSALTNPVKSLRSE